MELITNITNDKKDLVKANNAVLGFKDCLGDTIKMCGVVIYNKDEVDEKTGEITTKTVSAIKREDGEFITSVSPTVKNSLEMIVATYSEEEILSGIDIIIKSKKSNANRDFFYIDLV